jgi:hypothetical protein
MKTKMGLKKADLLTDSLESFWGRGAATKIESPRVDSTPRDMLRAPGPVNIGTQEDIMAPQEAYTEYKETGETIKETVEQSVNETQDLQPNVRAATEYSTAAPMGMMMQKKTRNPFDIGGFDEMIQKQMARERGSYNIGQGNFGMGPTQRLSGPEKMAKDIADFRFKAMKENYMDEKQYKRLAMMDLARQSRSKVEANRAITESYKQAALRERAQAGLPVYESPWDVIAGGKRVVKKKDADGVETTEIQRYGGLFGAVKDTSKAFGEAKMKVGQYFEKQKEKDLLREVAELYEKGGVSERTGNKFVTAVPQEKKEKTLDDFIDRTYTYAENKGQDEMAKATNDAFSELVGDKTPGKIERSRDLRDV